MAKAKTTPSLKDDPPTGPPRHQRYVIRSLEQAKLLADPLRLRVLREFAETPRTTKQVAELLDEKPSRLYTHVEALLNSGLLELKGLRQKRGAVEKYLQAIAYRFDVDSTLFLDEEAREDCSEQEKLVMSMMDTIRDELYRSAYHMDDLEHELKPLLLRFQLKGTAEEIKTWRQQLLDLMDSFQPSKKKKSDSDEVLEYAGAVLFYPFIKDDDDS